MDSSRLFKGRVPKLPIPSVVVPASTPAPSADQVVGAAVEAVAAGGEPYEVGQANVQMPQGIAGSFQSAGSTSQLWHGIDVYVDLSSYFVTGGAVGNAFVTCAVYAISKGVRVLVGTGRSRAIGALAPVHIAAVRVPIAERFEVFVGCDSVTGLLTPGSGQPQPSINVVFIAASGAPNYADDSSVGVIPLINQAQILPIMTSAAVQAAVASALASFNFVGLNAISTVATPRYVQLFDAAVQGPGAGAPPKAMWGLPAAGSTIYGSDTKLMHALGRMANPLIAISTTAALYTAAAAGDVVYQGFFK